MMTFARELTPGEGKVPPRRRWTIRRVWRATRQHGAGFLVELVLFFGVLFIFQISDYGGHYGWLRNLWLGAVFVTIAWGLAEARFKLYRRVWSVAGIRDAVTIAWAVALATLLLAVANTVLNDATRPFRYLVPLLAYPGVVACICAFRLMPRLLADRRLGANRLLVVVDGPRSFPAVKSLTQNAGEAWQPVAILSLDPADVGQRVMGVEIVGVAGDVDYWLAAARPDGIAFASGDPGVDYRSLYAACLAHEKPIFLVPQPTDWRGGSSGRTLRQLTADDFVGRRERDLDLQEALPLVAGRTVLITGAAGSIGSELSRLLAELQPGRLILLDNNESGLFDVARELRALTASAPPIEEALVSVTDQDALRSLFRLERPDVVFHAAAYKHVPMLEHWPARAVTTNVVGTRNVLECASEAQTQDFVFVSTDKAASRHSVMGCSKRMGELLVLTQRSKMRAWAVRFGNVVGSRGSVMPIFERQISEGGPVTITHPDATRYMMTTREAASLVVCTLAHAQPGRLYMLDMGEPINIAALAKSLIRSRGLRPDADIEIVYTGLRPGEELTERLLSDGESWVPTAHGAIREVTSPAEVTRQWLDLQIGHLEDLVNAGTREQIAHELTATVRRSEAEEGGPDPRDPAQAGLVKRPT